MVDFKNCLVRIKPSHFMKHSYSLAPAVIYQSILSFEWDRETGELSGKDSDTVAILVADAKAAGFVSVHPLPACIDIADPLTDPQQMAAVLGQFWHLPEDLQSVYPKVEDVSNNAELLNENGDSVDFIKLVQ